MHTLILSLRMLFAYAAAMAVVSQHISLRERFRCNPAASNTWQLSAWTFFLCAAVLLAVLV